MLLRPAEFTHASEKFEFTTKGFGASGAGRSLRRCRCPYCFIGCAAVANQIAAARMWLAGAMPLSTVHSNSLHYFSVILRNPWFSLGNNKCFWKENEKLYCENYWQCFRKNDEGGLFPLSQFDLRKCPDSAVEGKAFDWLAGFAPVRDWPAVLLGRSAVLLRRALPLAVT